MAPDDVVPREVLECCRTCLRQLCKVGAVSNWDCRHNKALQQFIDACEGQDLHRPTCKSGCVLDEYNVHCLPVLFESALCCVLGEIAVSLVERKPLPLGAKAVHGIAQLLQASTLCWQVAAADVKAVLANDRAAGAAAATKLLKEVGITEHAPT